jgi:hypothetical protein
VTGPSHHEPDDRPRSQEHGEIVEPPNSTVDDWFGQQASRDEEVVDDLLDETGGDVKEAERRFPGRSHEDRPDSVPTERRPS